MTDRILAWHFLPEDRRLRWGKWTNPVVRAGVTYVHPGAIELCQCGLHASVDPVDALGYAPGPIVCRVECWDRVRTDADKLVCGRRRVLWMADATRVLREFSCDCAARALERERERGREPDARSWAAIEVARRFARGEATEAELHAARDAAWDAAGDAAGAAAGVAAWDAAGDAARAAARVAAGAAAWDAAGDAARAAAGVAARAAARYAERQWQSAHLAQLLSGLEP